MLVTVEKIKQELLSELKVTHSINGEILTMYAMWLIVLSVIADIENIFIKSDIQYKTFKIT